MVNYNGGEELFRSMDSLQSDLSHEDHIFLIDNGSVDHSIERVQQAFPEVTVLLNRENQPFARATNRGIIQAKEQGFRFIGMINPDVRIRAGMTDSLSSSLENDRMTGAVSPVITYVTEPEKIWFAGGAICWWLGWSRHQYLGKRLDRLPNHPFRSKTLTGCCILAPAKIWETVGLLDDSYAMYTEDVDWSYRVRLRGFQLLVNPGAVLLHNVSSSTGGGRTPFKMKYRTLSSRLFFTGTLRSLKGSCKSSPAVWRHWFILLCYCEIMKSQQRQHSPELGCHHWKIRCHGLRKIRKIRFYQQVGELSRSHGSFFGFPGQPCYLCCYSERLSGTIPPGNHSRRVHETGKRHQAHDRAGMGVERKRKPGQAETS